jgi:hypothetical protein
MEKFIITLRNPLVSYSADRFKDGRNWGNYTLISYGYLLPVYARRQSQWQSRTSDAANVSVVTGGFDTTNQTTTSLGTF